MGLINELHRHEIGIVPIGDRFTMGRRRSCRARLQALLQLQDRHSLPLGRTFLINDQTPKCSSLVLEGLEDGGRSASSRARAFPPNKSSAGAYGGHGL